MTCAIDVSHVFFSYDGFRLEDINLQLHIGEQKAIAGLNGSGKTTLFKLILGLLEPVSGEIYVRDKKVSRTNLWEIRQDVGLLFQSPDDQLFAPTVWEDVAFGPRNLGLSPDDVTERVDWALDLVGMGKFASRPVNQLSHGEAKRVALAGIISMRPSILILDEPFSGLDFEMVKAMIGIFGRLREDGASILFTTHNSFFIENWSDSVAVMKEGRIVYDGPTSQAMQTKVVTENIGDWSGLRRQIQSDKRIFIA
ncbi:MAG: energy-coupling factor ABC transporter ATP-binding protein [Candidatus Thorarchaeota archaeon]|nr:MAG: energy-coupling factor ABC transporter ATP-binding protein [Candidatus Thorarchaeota archaeon]